MESLVRARVPATASGAIEITHEATGTGATVSLLGSIDTPRQDVSGHSVYPGGGPNGSDVIVRTSARGVEDHVLLSAPPASGELRYRFVPVDVHALRLVGHTLELLDDDGAPRVRVRPPYVVDANGERHAADMTVEGCAVDRDPRAPWGRDIPELEAASCDLVVRYDGALPHPVLVDPAWEVVTDFMGHQRTHHTSTLLPDGRVLVVGGFDETGAPVAQAEILCPEASICGFGGGVGFTVTGSLGVPRGSHTETLLVGDTHVLVTGGRTSRVGGTTLSSTELYDIAAGTFAAGPVMAVGRWGHTATRLATGDVLVAGGEDGVGASSAQLFNPSSGFGAAIPLVGGHRRGHMAETLGNGTILVAGGVGAVNNAAVATAEVFDVTLGTFSATDDMTSPRAWATATRLEDANGRVLIVGGTNNTGFYYKTVDIYDPTIGSGTFVQQLLQTQKPRAFHAATKLIGEGKVLVTGGFDGTTVHDDTEVFDSITATFVPLLSTTMNQPHNFHTATLLTSGKAVVIGGGVNGTSTNPGSGSVLGGADLAEILARSNGEPCNADGECLSNNCFDLPNGVCCNESCTDICSSCFAAQQADPDANGDGVCAVVNETTVVNPQCTSGVQLILTCVAGEIDVSDVESCGAYACNGDACGTTCTDDDDCNEDFFCQGITCTDKKLDGEACSDRTQCASGSCVDDVCCHSACEGTCQACDVEGFVGTCSQVTSGQPHGDRDPCEGSGGECAGECGSNPLKCDYDKAVECGASTCSGGVRNFGLCSLEAEGECAETTNECAPFACNEDGVTCVAQCETVADCEEGAVCKTDGTCAVLSTDECDGTSLLKADGTVEDCAPFLCSSRACLTQCSSVDDCAGGKVCDASGACIDPPPDPPPPDDCTVVGAPRSGSPLTLAAFALIGLAVAARRQERSR